MYGICGIIREDFVTVFKVRVREVDWDLEGRFLVCETEAREFVPKLAIFNCEYQCPLSGPISSNMLNSGYMVNGSEAPYKSSEDCEIQDTRHDRKLRGPKLLQDECRVLEKEGIAVILAGDMNVARTKLDGHPNLRTNPTQHCINRADFEIRFFNRLTDGGLQMVDSFRELHFSEAGHTYYPRQTPFGSSCDRVDLIMLSKVPRRSLKQAGMMETVTDRGPSDHVPLFAELDFTPSADDAEEVATL